MGCGHRCCPTPEDDRHEHMSPPEECGSCALRSHDDTVKAMTDPVVQRLLAAAHRVLNEHNVALAAVHADRTVVIETYHAEGDDVRCVECGEPWPCSLEDLRAAVVVADVAAMPIPRRKNR